jgi:AcrR family transcriptional regulator
VIGRLECGITHALEHVQPRDVRRDRGDELDRRGAGADRGDALAVQRDRVVPAGGVEGGALEALEPGEGGDLGLHQRAGAADQHPRAHRALRGLDLPPLGALVPARALDRAGQADVGRDAEVVDDAPKILAELGLLGVGARPAGIGREGERVQVRGHVAAAARVRVGPPGAAHALVALEDDEVLDALLAQEDREPDPGEPAADDGDGGVHTKLRYRKLHICNMSVVRMSAEQRREQLLDVTKRMVVSAGFHAVSIEAVAREAGITRPIVYGHFGDLAGLLEALVARESRRALAQLETVLPHGDLLQALQAYLEAVRADPDTWRLVLMPQEGAPKILHDRIARGRAAVVARLAHSLEPGLAAGVPDPELVAHMLSAYADEAARLLLTDPERFPAERVLALSRLLLRRLAA